MVVSYNLKAFVAVLLLIVLPLAAKGDTISPVLSPFFDEICKEVQCGKGSCEAGLGYLFNFRCNCEAGWRRTRLHDHDENDLQFLPCIIPNCSLDYSCMPAPPPSPPVPHNFSFFDPCYWVYCGEGRCTKNATYAHTCECNEGYSNLLDVPLYPCFRDCALGLDCARLGIRVSNSTSSTPSSSNSKGDTGHATSILPNRNSQWIAMLLTSAVLALWK